MGSSRLQGCGTNPKLARFKSALGLDLTVHHGARLGVNRARVYNTSLVQRGSVFCPPCSPTQGRLAGAIYQNMAAAPTLAVTADDSGVPPLPRHWILNGERDSPNYTGSLAQKLVLVTHRILCLITFGGTSLRPIWERSHCEDTRVWEEGRNSLRERIQHTNIVVSSFDLQRGGTFLDFRRAACSSQQSRPSAAPTHQRTPNSFHTRKKVRRVSYS